MWRAGSYIFQCKVYNKLRDKFEKIFRQRENWLLKITYGDHRQADRNISQTQ